MFSKQRNLAIVVLAGNFQPFRDSSKTWRCRDLPVAECTRTLRPPIEVSCDERRVSKHCKTHLRVGEVALEIKKDWEETGSKRIPVCAQLSAHLQISAVAKLNGNLLNRRKKVDIFPRKMRTMETQVSQKFLNERMRTSTGSRGCWLILNEL